MAVPVLCSYAALQDGVEVRTAGATFLFTQQMDRSILNAVRGGVRGWVGSGVGCSLTCVPLVGPGRGGPVGFCAGPLAGCPLSW